MTDMPYQRDKDPGFYRNRSMVQFQILRSRELAAGPKSAATACVVFKDRKRMFHLNLETTLADVWSNG